MADLKAEEDRRMESETGGYVNSSTGNIEIVADNEGNTAYVVGETLNDGHKIYILNKGGEKIPLNREDFEEEYKSQGTFDKDEFLGTIIMNRDLNEEVSSEVEEIAEGNNGLQDEINNESVVSTSTTYQGRPVHVIEGTEQEDGTVVVEDENGEAMRVPSGELEVSDIVEEQPEVNLQETTAPIQEEVNESVQSEIPLTDKVN